MPPSACWRPGVFLAFLWPRAHAGGVLAGIAIGYAALLLPAATAFWNAWFPGWDQGLLAMAVNAATVVLVCAVRGKEGLRRLGP